MNAEEKVRLVPAANSSRISRSAFLSLDSSTSLSRTSSTRQPRSSRIFLTRKATSRVKVFSFNRSRMFSLPGSMPPCPGSITISLGAVAGSNARWSAGRNSGATSFMTSSRLTHRLSLLSSTGRPREHPHAVEIEIALVALENEAHPARIAERHLLLGLRPRGLQAEALGDVAHANVVDAAQAGNIPELRRHRRGRGRVGGARIGAGSSLGGSAFGGSTLAGATGVTASLDAGCWAGAVQAVRTARRGSRPRAVSRAMSEGAGSTLGGSITIMFLVDVGLARMGRLRRRRLADVELELALVRRQRGKHDVDLLAVQLGRGIGMAHRLQLLQRAVHDLEAHLGVGHFAAAEFQAELHLVAVVEEFLGVAELGLEIVVLDARR